MEAKANLKDSIYLSLMVATAVFLQRKMEDCSLITYWTMVFYSWKTATLVL